MSNAPAPSAATRSPLLGLLVAQFFGAFNDNAFKMIVDLVGVRCGARLATRRPSKAAATLAVVVFTLPMMLGSLPAMSLGDRVGKRSLVVWTKGLEVALMALGTLALATAPVGWFPLVVLAGMGAMSALFAPRSTASSRRSCRTTSSRRRTASSRRRASSRSFSAPLAAGTSSSGPAAACGWPARC
jgi:MFS family permease